jgi:hypothetical protein
MVLGHRYPNELADPLGLACALELADPTNHRLLNSLCRGLPIKGFPEAVRLFTGSKVIALALA